MTTIFIVEGSDVSDGAAVELYGVDAGFRQRTVLHGVTARIPAGCMCAVVGPNGAGKSTLLDVIAGVRAPTAGSVLRASRLRPAYVVQRSGVADTLPITVRAAVEMGRWAQRGPWRRLRSADRTVVARCLSQLGLDDLADRRLDALSGGQRQRALVAQGLAQEADLLLLDEPTAGLDLQVRRRIDEALAAACARGVTVVRVTHELPVAQRADHCLLLRGGRVTRQGAPGEVLTAAAVRAAWGLQGTRLTAAADAHVGAGEDRR
jgi:zinc/manganese transport system ATP-binding protein